MRRVLCPQLPTSERPVELPETEAHHLLHVLRLEDGEQIEALNGKGRAIVGRLRVTGTRASLEFVSESRAGSTTAPITLEMAVLKGEAMEWVIEKAVELGVEAFVPVLAVHSVVKIKPGKGPEAFVERWQRIADQALKQCGRLSRMTVAQPMTIEQLLAQEPATAEAPRLWCDEAGKDETPALAEKLEALPKDSRVRLLIGPEGGWSQGERALLAEQGGAHLHRINLGPLVLRAETAALFAVSVAGALHRRG